MFYPCTMRRFKVKFRESCATILFIILGNTAAAAAAKSLQSCLTLCDQIDGNPPGSPVPGILQARTLEWVAISFSNAWKWKMKVKSLSRVWLSDPMDCSPPGSSIHGMEWGEYSRQEYWSGVTLPSPWVTLKGIYVPKFPNNQITIETNGIYYPVIQGCAFQDFLSIYFILQIFPQL